MSIEAVLLVATAVLAVISIVAAVVAVRAVRRVNQTATDTPSASLVPVVREPEPAPPEDALPVRIVEGRVVVVPTEQQVVATALGRPAVRLSVYAAGLAHALRPESRDRIAALMRREYRQRRRVRQQAGRRAARLVPADALRHRDDSWLGTTSPPEPPRTLPRAAGE